MAKDNAQAWQAIEEQAYHAFREWPLWLALRQKELAAHLQQAEAPANTTDTARINPTNQQQKHN